MVLASILLAAATETRRLMGKMPYVLMLVNFLTVADRTGRDLGRVWEPVVYSAPRMRAPEAPR